MIYCLINKTLFIIYLNFKYEENIIFHLYIIIIFVIIFTICINFNLIQLI